MIFGFNYSILAPEEQYVPDLQMLKIPIVNNSLCAELNDRPGIQVINVCTMLTKITNALLIKSLQGTN